MHGRAAVIEGPRARFAARAAPWLFPAIAGAMPPVAALAPLGIAPLIGVAGLWALAGLSASGTPAWKPRGALAAIFALLFVLAAVSTAWAVDPLASLASLPRLAGVLVCAGLVAAAAVPLEGAARRRTRIALAGGLALALLPPLADRVLGGAVSPAGLSIHNPGLSVVALLIWPASLLLARRFRLALVLLWAGALGVTFALVGESVKIALLSGLIAAGLGWLAPRRAPVLLAALAVAYIAAAPVLHAWVAPPPPEGTEETAVPPGYSWLPPSAYHRLLIWNFTARKIAEKPVLGWGYHSARRLPGGREELFAHAETLPLHPHNAVLQVWVELGVPGAALAAALTMWAAVRLRRTASRAGCAAVCGYFATAGVLLCAAFGLWQSWWLAALFLSAVLLAAARPDAG